jgi:hypothetical protein
MFENPNKAKPKKARNSARREAGIENFRFPDLRPAETRSAEREMDALTNKDIARHATFRRR